MTSAPVLIFDGDCAFCTSSADFARDHVATAGQFQVTPWQELDLTAYGLTPEACRQAAQFVTDDGRILSGHLAIAAALAHGKPVWRPAGWLLAAPGIRTVAEAVYLWVAAHRDRLPGGSPACAITQPDNSAAIAEANLSMSDSVVSQEHIHRTSPVDSSQK